MSALSTRDRLLDEGLRLFAEQGYRSTTIRQIEAAVGLQPGRGGFYRHFATKDELFQVCLQRYRDMIEVFGSGLSAFPTGTGDLREELEMLVRGALDILGAQGSLLRLLARDGADMPGVGAVHEMLVQRGYHYAGTVFRGLLKAHGKTATPTRVKAVSALALGAVVHFIEDEAVYGKTPAGATRKAFVQTWVDVWVAYLQSPDA